MWWQLVNWRDCARYVLREEWAMLPMMMDFSDSNPLFKTSMLDWTEIVDECGMFLTLNVGWTALGGRCWWYGNRATSIWKEWRSYRRNTYCILLSGLLLNATSTFPVMEQAERHIISKKLRKWPDFAEQKMAYWSGGEMRPLDHVLPQRSLRAQLPLESLLQLPRFIWKPPPNDRNRNTACFHQTSCKILLQIYECVSAR